MNPDGRSADDALVNLALILVALLGLLAAALRLAGSLAAWLRPPHSRRRIRGWASRPAPASRPAVALVSGTHPAAYWSVMTLMVGVTGGLSWVAWRLLVGVRHRAARDPRRLAGPRRPAMWPQSPPTGLCCVVPARFAPP